MTKVSAKAIVSILAAAGITILIAALIISCLDPIVNSILADVKPTVKGEIVKKTIIIDPGHGGADPGAVGANGSLEKELNLELSLTLCDLLEMSGFDVIMTRDDDRMLTTDDGTSKKSQDLSARLSVARDHPDALFVSIHMNKFPDSSVHGVQVYYSKNHQSSRALAEEIRKYVTASVQPSNKRQIKEATSAIFILDRIENPAVLVECGFISNSMEEALLRDREYRTALATAICGAIVCFSDTLG